MDSWTICEYYEDQSTGFLKAKVVFDGGGGRRITHSVTREHIPKWMCSCGAEWIAGMNAAMPCAHIHTVFSHYLDRLKRRSRMQAQAKLISENLKRTDETVKLAEPVNTFTAPNQRKIKLED